MKIKMDVQTDIKILTLFEKLSKGKKLSFDVYKYTVEERNWKKLVAVAFKALQKTDSVNANVEQAAKVAEQMQLFAREKLAELTKK